MIRYGQNKPKAVIVSPDIYRDSVCKLNSMGIEVLYSYKNKNVSLPLVHHVDMQIVYIGENTYISAPECYEYYLKLLKNFNVKIFCGNTYLSCNYPCDIAYNIIVTEKYAVHNFKYTDSILASKIHKKSMINVSQGYTACTMCVLSEKGYITSDAGIYNSLKKNNLDVLLVNDDSIVLPGFDHGFLGGSSTMLGEKRFCVNGDINLHPSFKEIQEFCTKHDVSLLSLSANPIMDIGSFVPIF